MGLEPTPAGLRPGFDATVMVQCIADLVARSYWEQWRSIRCPTLIVFGERGSFTEGHGAQLVRQACDAQFVTIAGAGHDLHLEAPGRWTEVLLRFLSGLEGPASS